MFQRLPVQKLHGDEGTPTRFANVVNRTDIGMVQCGGSLSFAPKSCECMLVTGDTLRKEFQGNEAMQTDVFGLVHHTHTAATELLNNAVMRDGLADERLELRHLTSMLGCSGRQVNEAAT